MQGKTKELLGEDYELESRVQEAHLRELVEEQEFTEVEKEGKIVEKKPRKSRAKEGGYSNRMGQISNAGYPNFKEPEGDSTNTYSFPY